MKLGTKIQKPIDEAQYTEAAAWCMSNGAIIVDKGDYYEVCENVPPEPTSDEKLNALDAQYQADKDKLRTAYQDALMYGDTARMESIKADLIALDEQYDKDYAEIESEGEDDE